MSDSRDNRYLALGIACDKTWQEHTPEDDRMLTLPDRNEAAPYYFTYIDQVAPGDIGDVLETQRAEVLALCAGISERGSTHRYAPDKWSIRQVLAHVNDCERLFAFRAMWFARGFD